MHARAIQRLDHVMPAVQLAALPTEPSKHGHLAKLLSANILEATPAAELQCGTAPGSPTLALRQLPSTVLCATNNTQGTLPQGLTKGACGGEVVSVYSAQGHVPGCFSLVLLGSWLPNHSRTLAVQ
jgi:hypothetical protein